MGHPTENQLPIPPELARLLADRIDRRVVINDDGCWIRGNRAPTQRGYTHITRTINGQITYYLAHRVMYVNAHGPIPDGLTIDHICEVRACCNPDHLRAVPHHENVIRGEKNYYAINARKTHCIHGHELPPYVRGGHRRCGPCGIERRKRYRDERRVA